LLNLLRQLISRDIGIDLGTATTLMYEKEQGIVLDEPSVVSVEASTGRILAVGHEAKKMVGRAPANIETIRPLHGGVIADFDIAEEMLRVFLSRTLKGDVFARPRVIICAPSGVTPVERKAVRDVAQQAGAAEAYIIDELMAAAIGAGLPVNEAIGSMVMDIGGGTTEVGVISLGSCVYLNSLKVAGDTLDEVVQSYLKSNYRFLAGISTAEQLKKELGRAMFDDKSNLPSGGEARTVEVSGRDLVLGLPRKVSVSENEIAGAMSECIEQMVDSVKEALEKTPPELASDIVESGIVLCGGGALIRDLDRALAKATNLPVRIADSPLTCVVRGTAIALDELDTLRKLS
jgi:rod shape-determining protein MreB